MENISFVRRLNAIWIFLRYHSAYDNNGYDGSTIIMEISLSELTRCCVRNSWLGAFESQENTFFFDVDEAEAFSFTTLGFPISSVFGPRLIRVTFTIYVIW